MNENKKHEALVDTLFTLGRDWASYGLGLAKTALEQSGDSLTKIAGALDGLRDQVETIGKKPEATPEAPAQTQA